jgi:antitoxin component YwqK of YwqJK toxin-antitoxin module
MMGHRITISLSLFFLLSCSFFVNAQDFGCYDISGDDRYGPWDGVYDKVHVLSPFFNMSWLFYAVDSVRDGYYKKEYFNSGSCSNEILMEGNVINGRQEGEWTLYTSPFWFYRGLFINGKKEGLWKGYRVLENSDTITVAFINFKNDSLDGESILHYPTGSYKKTHYTKGVKDGPEIEYLQNDSLGDLIIMSSNYSMGKMEGEYIEYSQFRDTIEYGKYTNGKKNGRFIYNNYRGKLMVDYKNDKVEGKLIRYYKNGALEVELDYKNDLPYNLIQYYDTNGRKIDTLTLRNGTGELRCYFDNGQLQSSFEYKGGLISGKFSRYYKSGSIFEKGDIYTDTCKVFKKTQPMSNIEDINLYSCWQLNFTKGTDYTIYNENGNLKEKACSEYCDSLGAHIIICRNYSDSNRMIGETAFLWGLKVGGAKKYYEEGSLHSMEYYKIIEEDGVKRSVKEGGFEYYYPEGTLKARLHYSNDKEVGESYYYDKTGVVKRTKVIVEDGEIYNVFNGDTVNRIDQNGNKQGKWIEFSRFYSIGNCDMPNTVKYYKDDKPCGIWEYYYLGGIIYEKVIWQDSINAYAHFYSWMVPGQLSEEGPLFHEMKMGEWKEYDLKRGYLKRKGQYNCGLKTGVWLEFKRNGKVKREVSHGL